jgi:glycosyltransferase involved in cell wall biosynthesis
MKLLAYCESPFHATGFGHVNQHILAALSRAAEVTVIATGHYYGDEYDREAFPYTILACTDTTDQRNLVIAKQQIEETDWDVFMYQGDFGANNEVLAWAYTIQQAHPERETIFYFPLDCDVTAPWAFDALRLATVPVVYTEQARKVVEKYAPDLAPLVSVIGLGTEPETFYPFSPEEKRAARIKLFGEDYADRFMVLNVNRNQLRKDLARCMAAFHLFHQTHEDSTLYMHSVIEDEGGNLITQAEIVGCDVNKRPVEIAFSSLNLADAWSREDLNRLYNACDVLVSTAYGEGWGLTTTEAMCAGTPVLVPANTANLDILGKERYHNRGFFYDRERGWAIKTGGDLDHTVFLYGQFQRGAPRDIIHTRSFVYGLEYLYSHPEEGQAKAQTARAWCLENTWKQKEAQWQQLLQMIKSHRSAMGEAPSESAMITVS